MELIWKQAFGKKAFKDNGRDATRKFWQVWITE